MVWELDKIKDYVESNMSKKRFKHVLGVVETARMLAMRHGVNEEDAMLAALVHDVVKEQDFEEAKQILVEKGETLYLEHSPKVWHAPLGAFVANELFGIVNEDILNAVRYHTTGKAEMSELGKVIFVADYTEPNRKHVGCIEVREFWGDLDQAVYEILKRKIEKTTAGAGLMHPDTLEAYAYYRKLEVNEAKA